MDDKISERGSREAEGVADDALLELVQRQTFGYFWDYAHPSSGMARDRGRPDGTAGSDLVALGGTGFGIMAIIVAADRGWIARAEAAGRLLDILGFLSKAE
ncbi:MAG: beta-glucosidase, partial [Rhodomicrobium sp.]|nr:beta-glucosidase [Rhodomicrobium sp.]